MSWFKVDDGSAFNAKVMAAGNEAWGAFCRVGAHCSQQLTDGHFSRAIAVTIAPMRVWTKLIEVGLVDDMERGEMRIHDYLQRNPSKEQVLRERAATKARVTDLRNGRRTTGCTPVQPPVVTVGVTRLPSRPVPSQPTEAAEPAAARPVREEPRSEVRIRTSDPSDEHALFEAKLRSLPKLADLDVHDLAGQCVGQVMRGKAKLDWVLTALEEADAKSQRAETSSTRHARAVGFIRSAKAPKVEPRDEREVKGGPAYSEFKFDPGEVKAARRAVPVRPKPADDVAPLTDEKRAELANALANFGRGPPSASTEQQLRDKAQADQRRLAEMTIEQERKAGAR